MGAITSEWWAASDWNRWAAYVGIRTNRANLADEYIKELEALPEKDRLRFLHGQYLTQVDGALWNIDGFLREAEPVSDDARQALMARMNRIIVSVDPSGCSGPEDTRSDEIGIIVAGVDVEGQGYVLADHTGHYSPEGWAKEAIKAYDEWQADTIVAERNFGGAMVENTIRAVRATVPVKLVTASRGKTARAQPVAALYEQSKVLHVGHFPDLEEQMVNFSASGYQGAKSPDRADAAVWALTELMLDGSTYDTSLGWV